MNDEIEKDRICPNVKGCTCPCAHRQLHEYSAECDIGCPSVSNQGCIQKPHALPEDVVRGY